MRTNNSKSEGYLNRIIRNSFFVMSAECVNILAGIFSFTLIARYLGLKTFGEYVLIVTISAFLVPFTDFGMLRITTRDVVTNKDDSDKYASSAFFIKTILSVFILFAFFISIFYFNLKHAFIYAILMSIISQSFISFALIYKGLIRTHEKMEYELIFSLIQQAIFLLCIIIVITRNCGFLYLFFSRLLADLSYLVLFFKKAKKFGFPLSLCKFKRDSIWFLFKEALPLGVYTLLLTALFKIDIFILGLIRGSAEVSLFEVSNRIIMQLPLLAISILVSLSPSFSQMAKDSMETLRSYYEKTFKFFFILSAPLSISIFFASRNIIVHFFGREFLQASASLSILAWTIIFLFLASLQNFTLIAIGKQKIGLLSVFVGFLVNLILDIVLIPEYGYIGASIATLISYFIFFAVIFYLTRKYIGDISLSKVFLKPGISALAMFIFCYSVIKGNDLFLLIIWLCLSIIIYVLLLFFLKVFTKGEIGTIKMLLKVK